MTTPDESTAPAQHPMPELKRAARLAEAALFDSVVHERSRVGAISGDIQHSALPTVGRYQLRRLLGRGGMGSVYEAFDTELHRTIAIKLLYELSADDERRMYREARTLARLNHPHVVQIYDVGKIDGQAYITMELAACTLRGWSAESERSWSALRDVLGQAARGLHAAHQAGLVHRDIKPTNVLVGVDGRARVADFGLARDARSLGEPEQGIGESTETDVVPTSEPRAGSVASTGTGTIAGTPAYMAPEHRAHGRATAAADQFSFCVMTYEAVVGRRPFSEGAVEHIDLRVRSGAIRRVLLDRGVSPRAAAAIERGLAVEPEERHATMEALLEALLDDPERRRRRRWLLGGGLVVALGGAWGYRAWVYDELSGLRDAERQMCDRAAERMGEVWSEERLEGAREAVVGTELPFAESTWQRLEPRLEHYARQWDRQHELACEASVERGEQSRAVLDLRLICLRQRGDALRALLDALGQADGRALERAEDAMRGLDSPVGCSDIQALVRDELPRSELGPEEIERANRADSALAVLRVRRDMGAYADALTETESLVERVRELPVPALQARAATLLGELQLLAGEPQTAYETLLRVYEETEHLGLDVERLRAAHWLMQAAGTELRRFEEGLWWGRQARALLVRLGSRAQSQYVGVMVDLASVHSMAGKARHSNALLDEISKELGPDDDLVRASALSMMGKNANDLGDAKDARRRLQQSLALFEETLGRQHPRLLDPLLSLILMNVQLGDFEEASALAERAVALARGSLGDSHPNLGKVLSHTARVHAMQGELDQASALYREALEVLERAYGPDDVNLMAALVDSGSHAGRSGDLALAGERFERALEIGTHALGESAPELVAPLEGLAQIELVRGRLEEGRAYLVRARTLAVGLEDPFASARIAVSLGEANRSAGRLEDAERAYSEAIAGLGGAEGGRERLGRAISRAGYVRVRHAQGVGVEDLAGDVRKALDDLEGVGSMGEMHREKLMKWWEEVGAETP